jgi:hypothetical protein
LSEDDRIKVAALIGHAFHIDPLDILDADYFEWAVREAAFHALNREMAKASKKRGVK